MSTAALPVNYRSSTDPKKVAANNREIIATQGQDAIDTAKQRQQEALALAAQNKGIYDTNTAKTAESADYLNAIEDPLAKGQGGYSAEEKAQIELTPEQQQQMVTSAGISAGTNTAAATDAAQRATNAAGGNPAALAAYRARAASNIGAQAGDAQTTARVAASNAAADRAKTVGDARLAQQTQGLNYYQSQNAQSNTNANNALTNQLTAQGLSNQATGLQNQAYGTETSGVNQAAQTAQAASQNPTTFDKVMGGVSGALSFLEDGDTAGEDAIVGENGPEAIVKNRYLDDGDIGSGEVETEGHGLPTEGAGDEGGSGEADPRSWMRQMMDRAKAGKADTFSTSSRQNQQTGMAPSIKSWETVGKGAGLVASQFLEDGDIEDGMGTIITKPTHVRLDRDDAVIPLSYRAQAKVRPSAALPLVHNIQKRRSAYRAS